MQRNRRNKESNIREAYEMVMDYDDVVSGDDGWKELELLPKNQSNKY
jgi:hypothetical protein